MMYAYDKTYLEYARVNLAGMLDYAINDLQYELSDFWKMFLSSEISYRFENGDPSILVGRSGVELALMVCEINKDYKKPSYSIQKSKEYWLGWALAYFQWKTCISFSQLTKYVKITEIIKMYSPYHEMDIRQFCDEVFRIYKDRKKETNLRLRRLDVGLSQSELATISGVPLRTLQQYEQAQKNINLARAEYVINLSRALYCNPKTILENNNN